MQAVAGHMCMLIDVAIVLHVNAIDQDFYWNMQLRIATKTGAQSAQTTIVSSKWAKINQVGSPVQYRTQKVRT